MTIDDVSNIIGESYTTTGVYLTDAKYENLFHLSQIYWLASPYPSNSNRLWLVNNYGALDYNYHGTHGVRPVVSLKSDVRASGKDMIDAWDIVMP